MFPVFSLVLDKDVKSEVAMLYPELYKDLLKVSDNLCSCQITKGKLLSRLGLPFLFFQGRPLSYKTFLIWVLISIYQGKLIWYLFYYTEMFCMDKALGVLN